jgi:hypothetical protein
MYPPIPLLTPPSIRVRWAAEAGSAGREPPGQRGRDAGGRTRTSKGVSPQRDLNPPRLPVPPRPPQLKDRERGYSGRMTDQADRERESRESDITKFEEQRLEYEAEREASAEQVQGEQKTVQDEP